MVLVQVILLQKNHEFQLIGAILSQDLVAGQRTDILVPPVVECGHCVSRKATFSC